MICGASDGCHFCGKKGHFIRDCYSKKNKDKYKTKNKEFLEASKNYESADEVEFDDDVEDDVEDGGWSCSYCNREFSTKKGAQFHENIHCKVKNK